MFSHLAFLGLRFRDAEVERDFQGDYARHTLWQMRASLFCAGSVWITLAFQDHWFFPVNPGRVLMIRLVEIVLIALTLAASFHSRFRRWQQPWLAAQALFFAAGILLMIQWGDLETANSYYFGLMLAIVWAFNFSGLRFYPALAVSAATVIAFGIVFGIAEHAPAKWVATNVGHLISATFIAGFAGYLIEWQRRELFRQHRELDEERATHQQLALTDQLTGLPNRLSFERRLATVCSGSGRKRDRGAVLFLDVDDFKQINDSHGHGAGDQVLIELGSRFSKCLRDQDLLARMSGDEFLVLVDDVRQPAEVAAVAQKLIEAIHEPLNVSAMNAETASVEVGISIGIALFPLDGRSAEELVQAADAAMYAVKLSGRNGYRFCESVDAAASG